MNYVRSLWNRSTFILGLGGEGGRGTRKSENTSTPSSNEAMATP